jgi:trimethylamine:corrinoid methyltransferase-like protein
VRELESRARAAGLEREGPPAESAGRLAAADADAQAAAEQIADALGAALGADVQVHAGARGFSAQLRFASLEEALALVARLSG